MTHRHIAALLGAFLLLAPLWTPAAHGLEPEQAEAGTTSEEPEQPQEPETAEPWLVSLPGGLVVGAGEDVLYQTVSPKVLQEPKYGYYPGELTIETGGQIVVKAGGSLTIGKFAIGSSEASPVLRGTLREDGLIRVEAGGRLTLNSVTLDTKGAGLVVVQEDGALVEVHDTDLTGLVQWGAPAIDNTYTQLRDLWLEAGTPLTADILPAEKRETLLEAGRERQVLLPIRWTLPEEIPPMRSR